MQSELMKLHGQFSHITNGIQCTIPIVCLVNAKYGRLTLIIDNKHYINAIKLHGHLLVWMHGIYVTICWTSDDCDGQVDLKLHLSVGQVILFPYFDH